MGTRRQVSAKGIANILSKATKKAQGVLFMEWKSLTQRQLALDAAKAANLLERERCPNMCQRILRWLISLICRRATETLSAARRITAISITISTISLAKAFVTWTSIFGTRELKAVRLGLRRALLLLLMRSMSAWRENALVHGWLAWCSYIRLAQGRGGIPLDALERIRARCTHCLHCRAGC